MDFLDKITPAHPIANLWPWIDADTLLGIAADIKENGQQEPIIKLPNGLIVDGRNRELACFMAGVEPKYVTEDIPEPEIAKRIQSLNNHRRHPSPSQLAMVAARLDKFQKGQTKANSSGEVMTQSEAADAIGASARMIRRANAVLEKAPELVDAIMENKLDLTTAESVLNLPAAARKRIAAAEDPKHAAAEELRKADRPRGLSGGAGATKDEPSSGTGSRSTSKQPERSTTEEQQADRPHGLSDGDTKRQESSGSPKENLARMELEKAREGIVSALNSFRALMASPLRMELIEAAGEKGCPVVVKEDANTELQRKGGTAAIDVSAAWPALDALHAVILSMSDPKKKTIRGPLRDERGRVVPEKFVAEFEQAKAIRRRVDAEAQRLRGMMTWILSTRAGRRSHEQMCDMNIEKLQHEMKCGLPYCCCPDIHQKTGEHLIDVGKCRVCEGRGWVSRSQYETLLPDMKDRIKAASEASELTTATVPVTVYESDDHEPKRTMPPAKPAKARAS